MKKVFLILGGVMCFVAFYFISDTYGLFESNKDMLTSNDLAAWTIKINDNYVTEQSFNVDQIYWNETEFVKEGKVAPNMSGYFDLIIDPSGTEVSIRYDIEFDFSNLSNKSLIVESIEETSNQNLTQTGEFIYTGVIDLQDIQSGTMNTVRVHILWENNEDNNQEDSLLASAPDQEIDIPVSIHVSQYLGETIQPYVSE